MSISSNEIRARLTEEKMSTQYTEGIWERLEALDCECCEASLTAEINRIKDHNNWVSEDEKNNSEGNPKSIDKVKIQCDCCERWEIVKVAGYDEGMTASITVGVTIFDVDMDGESLSCQHCESPEVSILYGFDVDYHVEVECDHSTTLYSEDPTGEDIKKNLSSRLSADIWVGERDKDGNVEDRQDIGGNYTFYTEKPSAPDTSEKDDIISALVQQIKEYSDNDLVIAKKSDGSDIVLSVAKLYEKFCFQPHYELLPKGNVWEIRYFTTPTESEWIATGKDKQNLETTTNLYNLNMDGGACHG